MNALTLTDVKQELANTYHKQVTNYFQNNEKEALKFMSAISNSIQQNPKLLECEKTSLFNSFMKCAEYKIYPSSVSGEAYILPYSVKGVATAQFQLGYKGIITLLYRAGVTGIYSDIVKKNDTIRVISGISPTIEHEYNLGDRGEAIGVYVWAEVNGSKMFKYMSKAEVETFKKFSQSASSKNDWARESSPWNIDKDPELNMWRKTCLKQLSKMLPMNEDIYNAIAEDNKEADIEDYAKKAYKEKLESKGVSSAALLGIEATEEAREETPEETKEREEKYNISNNQ